MFGIPFFCQKLCLLLVKHQRTSLLPSICNLVADIYQHDVKIMTFTISSSETLTDQQKKKIETFLHKHVDETVSCSYTLDKTLIAGVRLQSDCLLWEDSIRGRLQTLQESLGN